MLAYSPVKTLALADVRTLVRDRVIEARASELARKEATEKLALWEKEPEKAALSGALIVARDQPQNLPAQIVTAALKADAKTTPVWLGVDLGPTGYSLVRILKVVPRNVASQPTVAQDREQYAQWWAAAETAAYAAALKERLKVEFLIPQPPANVAALP